MIKMSKVPTWLDKNNQEGIEFNGHGLTTFWVKDGGRVYGEPATDKIDITVEMIRKELNGNEKNAVEGDKGKADNNIKSESKEAKEPDNVGSKELVKADSLKKLDKKEHNTLQVGNFSALAKQYGIAEELVNLFFMKFDDRLYIKNPGLLYLANKKGYGHIETSDKYDEKKKEWEAETKVYPVLTREIVEAISKLDKDVQLKALEMATMPTNGIGRAGEGTIKMSTMKVYARELAQTRSQNRALRVYTGYGGTSAEELETVNEKEV